MTLASLGDSPRSTEVSELGSFQMTLSVLGSEVCAISACPLRVESIFPEPSGFPKRQSKMSLEACLSEAGELRMLVYPGELLQL